MERYYTKSSGTSTKRSRSESSSIDLFQGKQNECAIAIPSSQNKPTIEGPLDLYVPNPGKRLPIMRIAKSAQEREMIRRIYLTNGPCQPKLDNFPQSLIGGKMRRFSPQWYNEFGPWLEYSESKDAVFCLHCYLFHCEHGDGRGGHDSFVVEGFRNWKDKQQIFKHIGKVGSTHNLCVSSAKNLMNQNQHIDKSFPPNPESPQSTRRVAKAGWFLGLGDNKKLSLPDIVKAGDPVLHKPAQEVNPDDISSERIQKIIDDMIKAMRKAPRVGLAAPQIGIPSRIIVLEDREEYISYAPKEEIKAQDRRPFDLMVILNPKLEKRSDRTALFFEGCLSLDGFRAAVERYLDVEVTGLDRNGEVIKINASGWQARILQHECDHLDGTLYVDKMIPRTFRTVENLDLPLAQGCPKLGSR